MSEECQGPKMELSFVVRNPEGKIIREMKQKAHSWLRNYYIWFEMLMRLGPSQTVKDSSGKDKVISAAHAKTWDSRAAAKNGIGIGKSGVAEDISHYALQDLAFVAVVNKISSSPTEKTVTFQADISCTSEVSIKESGIFFHLIQDTSGLAFTMYIERTKLDSPVSVPAGGSVTVKYTIEH